MNTYFKFWAILILLTLSPPAWVADDNDSSSPAYNEQDEAAVNEEALNSDDDVQGPDSDEDD